LVVLYYKPNYVHAFQRLHIKVSPQTTSFQITNIFAPDESLLSNLKKKVFDIKRLQKHTKTTWRDCRHSNKYFQRKYLQAELQNIEFVGFMVLNATFNNISVISWRSVLLMEEIGVPEEIHW